VSWFVFLTKYYLDDEIKVHEKGEACNMYRGEKCTRGLVGKNE
jgi:hypothetical protein